AHHEPVRHRGLSRGAARAAQTALSTTGRVTMLLEAHLPAQDAPPSKGAEEFAAALQGALPGAVAAVRGRRAPDWGPVHEALERWQDEEAERPGVAVRGAELLVEALDDLPQALAVKPGRGGHTT
ncbi:MAG: FUSC family protein, partial [Streptomyces sp.]|nr:FUSC family protein [Streptomyces sp.]